MNAELRPKTASPRNAGPEGETRKQRSDGVHARAHLLHTALRLFSDKGFAKTSIRDIAQAAGANVAAVSYYFGDKAGLYRAVFTEPLGSARPVRGDKFDVKHSPGGMVDAEFAVQFLVLSESARHPELIANVGNISLLQRAEAAGLLPAGVGQRAAAAYRELRRVQHHARLNEEPTQVSPPALQAECDAIRQLWISTFKSND